MEMTIDVKGLESAIKSQAPERMRNLIKKSMKSVAREWETEAKRIISDDALDTGEFANSVHYEMFDDYAEIGFTGYDGVNYGVHFEYGTVRHWVPFYYYGDVNKPVLADWGHRVLGMSEEEMVKMGGIEVEIPELKPFMRAMITAQEAAAEIFKKNFEEKK